MAPAASKETLATDLSFHNFLRLPFELRAMIWRLTGIALRLHRLVEEWWGFYVVSPPPPVTLGVCRESRMLALQQFQFLPRDARNPNDAHNDEDDGHMRVLQLGPATVVCDPETDTIVMNDTFTFCNFETTIDQCTSNPWEVFRNVSLHYEYFREVEGPPTCFPGLQTITYTYPVPDRERMNPQTGRPRCIPRLDFFSEDTQATGMDYLEECLLEDKYMDMEWIERSASFLRKAGIKVHFALIRDVCQCEKDTPCREWLESDDRGTLANESMLWRERDMVCRDSVLGRKKR